MTSNINISNNHSSKKTSVETVAAPSYTPAQKWFVWGVAALFYLYETFLRVSPSVMTHSLMKDFGVSSTSLGVLSSFYYYSYVPLQIPCGLIVDKIGIRKIVSLSCVLCIIGTLLFAESENILFAEIGRFVLGAGSACAFISCLKITVEWFTPLQFALVAGLTNMMGTFGGLFAGHPLATLVNFLGWRHASFYLALSGIPIAIFAWFYLKKTPPHSLPTKQISFSKSLPYLIRNKQVWLAGITGGLMYLPITAFAELWGVPFLMHAHSINNQIASSISHMVFIGMALGSPFMAWLFVRLKSIKLVMQLSALLAGIIFIAIAYIGLFPMFCAYIFVFSAGLCIGGQVLCFTVAKNNTSSRISGTTIGFTNALVMVSGIIFQPLLGHILDLFWDGTFTDTGIRNYSTHAYQMSILTIPICLLISLFLLHFIKNNSEKK